MTALDTGSTPHEPTFAELFTPKLLTVLREGYRGRHLRADALAGLTVAIVALPLSMAIAIASGATPTMGLYTAIVGGFFVSAFGGSRFQIGGPAGAFIVLVAATVAQHGIDGLILATILSGVMMLVAGFLRLGTYIKFIPYPVTIGFTAGIAVIILASQLHDFLGLTIAGVEPGALEEKLPVLWQALPTLNPAALGVALTSVAIIVGLKKWRPHWPGMLVAVVLVSVVAALSGLPIETIGSKFGGIAAGMPFPSLPDLSLEKMRGVLPNAMSFALLGAIESLLSAVVADGMTGRRHRSNCELVGQGVANIASGLFGGFCVTGTIARTATNVRSGAHGPIAGMMHSLFLLAFLLVAAPLASYIPLAALAGVLVVVAWNMVERQAMTSVIRASRPEGVILLTTFGLTIFRDLTEAIIVGFAMGGVLFIHRMSKAVAVRMESPFIVEDQADNVEGENIPYDEGHENLPSIVVYRITGAFFFGAATTIGSVLDRVPEDHRYMIVDLSAVPFLDVTAANILEGMARKAQRQGVDIILTGMSDDVRQDLEAAGVRPPLVSFDATIDRALVRLRAI